MTSRAKKNTRVRKAQGADKTERRISQRISDKDRAAFEALTRRLQHHTNVLFCAVQTIETNDAVDSDEEASRVRNVLFETQRKLCVLDEELDAWYVEAEVRS